MLLRALEMGVQKVTCRAKGRLQVYSCTESTCTEAAELFEKSADLAMNCSHCVTEMEA